jgi:hypothetical protein
MQGRRAAPWWGYLSSYFSLTAKDSTPRSLANSNTLSALMSHPAASSSGGYPLDSGCHYM